MKKKTRFHLPLTTGFINKPKSYLLTYWFLPKRVVKPINNNLNYFLDTIVMHPTLSGKQTILFWIFGFLIKKGNYQTVAQYCSGWFFTDGAFLCKAVCQDITDLTISLRELLSARKAVKKALYEQVKDSKQLLRSLIAPRLKSQ